MSGKLKAKIYLTVFLFGYVASYTLHAIFNKTYSFQQFIHSEFIVLIGHPIAVCIGMLYYSDRTKNKLDWFGKLLAGILLIVWIIVLFFFLKDTFLGTK